MLPLTDPPVLGLARGWRLLGGDLDESALGDALRVDVMHFVKANTGYLGGYIALDKTHIILHTVSLWASESALALSASTADRVVDAIARLTAARVVGPTAHDVLHRHLDPSSSLNSRSVQGAADVEAMRAHIVVLEGPGAVTPSTLAALTHHLEGTAVSAPGYVASLLLRSQTDAAVTVVALWTNDEAAARGVEVASDAFHELVTGRAVEVTASGIHPVLVYEHPPTLGND